MSAVTELDNLLRDPDITSVEIKITVLATQEALVRAHVREQDLEPEERRVFFYDTKRLELFDGGVVLRARVKRDDDDDSTVKLRPVDPAAIDGRWKAMDGFEIELDLVGDKPTCSAKLDETQKPGEIDEVADGDRDLRKLFSEDQEDLIRAFKPEHVSWDELKVLGPVEVQKWEWAPPGFAHAVTIEEWVLPDESDFTELSIKVDREQAVEAGKAFRDMLVDRGLDPDGDQETKTRWALEFFAARL
jgi:hypothetical protein